MMWSIELPYPPSGNHRNGFDGKRTFRRDSTTKYFRAVAYTLLAQSYPKGLCARLSVTCTVHPPDRRKRDLDNAWKAAGDALTEAGVWLDDFQIDALQLLRAAPVQGGKIVVDIQEIA